MNKLSQLRKPISAFMLVGIAAFMLSGCSSSEESAPPAEEPPPGGNGGGTGYWGEGMPTYEDCMAGCTGNQAQCENTCSVYE